jgi:hypothetical protein
MLKRFPEILPKSVPGVIVTEDPAPDRNGLVGLSVSYSHAHYKTPQRSRKSAFRMRRSVSLIRCQIGALATRIRCVIGLFELSGNSRTVDYGAPARVIFYLSSCRDNRDPGYRFPSIWIVTTSTTLPENGMTEEGKRF